MNLITNTDKLAAACSRFAAQPFITIDTEFLRENTFWPKLCLIQMACADEELIIDPLSEGLDLSPFFELMNNPDVVKVFHAARQDIEIIYNLSRTIPKNLFDTQIAAMVCGFGESVSYEQLVKRVTRQDLDKSSRFTDWSKRPLTDRQLKYALADVTHLRQIYIYLKSQLDTSGRLEWVAEELALLTDPETYIQRPETAWKRLKMRIKSRQALAIMMELAAWREKEAQRLDVPRSRVIKDDLIYDIANQAPKTVNELSNLRTVNEGIARSAKGKQIIEAVLRGKDKDPQTLPDLKKGKPLPPQASAVIDLLRVLLKAAASKHDVATKLIATTDELEKIAINDKADVRALKGWRYELFGADALALKKGNLSLAIENGCITTMDTQRVELNYQNV